MNIFSKAEQQEGGILTRRSNACRWYPVPDGFREKAVEHKFSAVAMRLGDLLYKFAYDKSAVLIELPDSEAAQLLKTDRETVIKAREQLVEAGGLFYCEIGDGWTITTYRILNPETGKEIPKPSSTHSGVRKHKPTRKLSEKPTSRRDTPCRQTPTGAATPPCRQTPTPPVGTTDTPCRQTPTGAATQVLETTNVKTNDRPLNKDSEVKTLGDVAFAPGSGSEGRSLVPWEEIASGKKGGIDRIADALAEEPAAVRLAEKFGARIVGIIDQRTKERSGKVGPAGMPPEDWWRREVVR